MKKGGETMPTKAELEEHNAVLREALEEACDLIHGALGIEDADESEDDEG